MKRKSRFAPILICCLVAYIALFAFLIPNAIYAKYNKTITEPAQQSQVADFGVSISTSSDLTNRISQQNSNYDPLTLVPNSSGVLSKVQISGCAEVAVEIEYSVSYSATNWSYNDGSSTTEWFPMTLALINNSSIIRFSFSLTKSPVATGNNRVFSTVSSLLLNLKNTIEDVGCTVEANTTLSSDYDVEVRWVWQENDETKDFYLLNTSKPLLDFTINCQVSQVD